MLRRVLNGVTRRNATCYIASVLAVIAGKQGTCKEKEAATCRFFLFASARSELACNTGQYPAFDVSNCYYIKMRQFYT